MLVGTGPLTCLFFFNDTATTEIYTLSLHDALPISRRLRDEGIAMLLAARTGTGNEVDAAGLEELNPGPLDPGDAVELLRSEEHTSELQSRQYLVCRLLLEKTYRLADRSLSLRTPQT